MANFQGSGFLKSWGGTKIRNQKLWKDFCKTFFCLKGLLVCFWCLCASYSDFLFCIVLCQGFEITSCSTTVYWLPGRCDMQLTCLLSGMFKTNVCPKHNISYTWGSTWVQQFHLGFSMVVVGMFKTQFYSKHNMSYTSGWECSWLYIYDHSSHCSRALSRNSSAGSNTFSRPTKTICALTWSYNVLHVILVHHPPKKNVDCLRRTCPRILGGTS